MCVIPAGASRPSFEYLILLISRPRWIGEPSQITASLPEVLRRNPPTAAASEEARRTLSCSAFCKGGPALLGPPRVTSGPRLWGECARLSMVLPIPPGYLPTPTR